MGNLLFYMLHLCALLFGIVGLIITIPLHLIYCATNKKWNESAKKVKRWIANPGLKPIQPVRATASMKPMKAVRATI